MVLSRVHQIYLFNFLIFPLDSPLLSKKASSQLGDMLVNGPWRGIPYVRKYRKPKVKESARLRRVNDLFRHQTRRWAKLSEKERLAWSAFTALIGAKGTPLSVFTKYSTLALDAGFPQPVFSPRMKNKGPDHCSFFGQKAPRMTQVPCFRTVPTKK